MNLITRFTRRYIFLHLFFIGLIFSFLKTGSAQAALPNTDNPKPGQESSILNPNGDDSAEVPTLESFGSPFKNGQESEKDRYKNIQQIQKVADQGDAKAQRVMGFYKLMGLGVPKNISDAVHWFRKSADQGDAVSESLMGTICLQGIGVAKNITEALKWFKKAADQGDARADIFLVFFMKAVRV